MRHVIKNSKAEGSVTVFLSCILLIIIVFTCMVIDGTRIQIAKMQALRALRSATQSVIANYDVNMAHEYGMFATKEDEQTPIDDQIEMYALAALQPKKNLPELNQMHQLLYKDPPKDPFQLYDYDLEVLHIKPTSNLVEGNTDYIQLQILEYMKYRAPMLLIEPFLEKLQLITKATKTTKYVKKKMEVEKSVTEIDDLYRELEKYIDGLHITKNGHITYEDYFVKKMAYQKEQDKIFLNTIPDDAVKHTLNQKIFRLYEKEPLVTTYMHQFDRHRGSMVSTYKRLYHIKQQLSEKRNELSSLQSDISAKRSELSRLIAAQMLAIDDLNEDGSHETEDAYTSDAIRQLEHMVSELQTSMDDVSERINTLEQEERATHDHFHHETEKVYHARERMLYHVQYINTLALYRAANHHALDVIERIEKESSHIKQSINGLEQELNQHKDDLIESAVTSMEGELKTLKGRLAIPDDPKKTYHLTNNVVAMKDELEKNIKQLETIVPVGQELFQYMNRYHLYYMLHQQFDPHTENQVLRAFMQEVNQQTGQPYCSYPTNYIQNLRGFTDHGFVAHVSQQMKIIHTGLQGYHYDYMAFDYGDMRTLSKEEKEKQDPRNHVTKISENSLSLEANHDVTGEVNTTIRPSIAHPDESQPLVTDEKMNFINEKQNKFMDKSLDMFSRIGDKISNTTMNLRNELYINEYIIGQFATATDHGEGGQPVTLSGYSKDTHYLNHEAEYILRGSLHEKTNLQYVSHTIMGIRFVMNYLHLLTNTEKRTFIMGVATSIAGWWTFGLGVYIVAALMMAAWSYVESLVDVRYLLEGKKVPFLKTRTDWYTSFNGIVKGIVEEVGDYAADQSVQLIDALSNSVQHQVSYVADRFNDDVGSYVQNKMGEVLDQAERTIQYSLDEVDRVVDGIIDDTFHHIRDEIGEKPTAKDYHQIKDSGLSNHLITIIYRDYGHQIMEASYAELLTIKKEILSKAKRKIETTKQAIVSKVMGQVEGISDQFENKVNQLVKETASKYKDVTKKEINRITTDIQKNVDETLNQRLNEVWSQPKEKNYASLMPSFSYNDYLRLMLLIGIDDDLKLYRVMDLIQFNLQKNREDSSVVLTDYGAGYEVTAEVSVNYMFFGLPFMPEKSRDRAKNRYTFTIRTAMTY